MEFALDPTLLLLLCFVAFLAGFIDSVVGGGGLIQVPALFSLFPTVAPATFKAKSTLDGTRMGR